MSTQKPTMHTCTRADANRVLQLLTENAIDAVIVGDLLYKDVSGDIDILVKSPYSARLRQRLLKILTPLEMHESAHVNYVRYVQTPFGNVDVFFNPYESSVS
jgi:hypothetical protein